MLKISVRCTLFVVQCLLSVGNGREVIKSSPSTMYLSCSVHETWQLAKMDAHNQSFMNPNNVSINSPILLCEPWQMTSST